MKHPKRCQCFSCKWDRQKILQEKYRAPFIKAKLDHDTALKALLLEAIKNFYLRT